METDLQFIIDIAPIALLIIVIIQVAEFRKKWWETHIGRIRAKIARDVQDYQNRD